MEKIRFIDGEYRNRSFSIYDVILFHEKEKVSAADSIGFVKIDW